MNSHLKKTKQMSTSTTTLYLNTMLSGIVGTVLLLVFFSTLVEPSLLVPLLAPIVAFNGAGAGFGFRDKHGHDHPHHHIFDIVLAAIFVATGCTTISLLYPWESMFDVQRYLISFSITLLCTYFGSWLARRNQDLKSSPAPSTLTEEV